MLFAFDTSALIVSLILYLSDLRTYLGLEQTFWDKIAIEPVPNMVLTSNDHKRPGMY